MGSGICHQVSLRQESASVGAPELSAGANALARYLHKELLLAFRAAYLYDARLSRGGTS